MPKKEFLAGAAVLASAALAAAAPAHAGDLQLQVYNPGTKAIFPVTSTLIYGDKDAILVDAQFQKPYVMELIKQIKATGKNLTEVYISHSDPDYYFGLDEIKKSFPDAKIVATAQTAYLISASKAEKLGVWGSQLKEGAPSEVITPMAIDGDLELEGHTIQIVRTKNDPAHSFVWIPELKTVLGGISVTTGTHLWMADTKNAAAIDMWTAQLDKMQALNPEKVIPSHYAAYADSPKNLEFIKSYLATYKTAAATTATGDKLAKKMIKKYPDLPGKDELEMGAKVFKGEMEWGLKSPYPAIGNKVRVNFGDQAYLLDFKDNLTMSFSGDDGAGDDVEYTAVEVSPNVFMVYWSEPKLKSNVVHVQDFNQNIVYTNIAEPDGSFTNLKGTMKIVE